MTEWVLAVGSAFWLGILTSISPCPLAANITAVSFVARRVGSPLRVLLAGLLYTLGRAITYLVLGVLLEYQHEGLGDLLHGLVELRLGRVLRLHSLHQGRYVVAHNDLSSRADPAPK